MKAGPIDRLRSICLVLPEAAEQETWGSPTFRVRGKIFAMAPDEGGRPAVWCKAPPGAQGVLIGADAARFFAPPYVGPKGWIGVWLDRRPDWAEVAGLVERSWRLTAPKRVVRLRDDAGGDAGGGRAGDGGGAGGAAASGLGRRGESGA